MKRFPLIVLIGLSVALASMKMEAQVSFTTEYYGTSNFHDKDGNTIGKGDLAKCVLSFTQPVGLHMTSYNRPQLWIMSARAVYAQMDNEREAASLNPDKIINTSANLTFMAPVGDEYDLIVSGGAGIYAETSHVSGHSILFNGAGVVTKQITPSFKAGVGVMLTNSYGDPALMPAIVFDWKMTGKYTASVSMLNGIKAQGSTQLSEKWKLSLTAIEMDAISAVMKHEGRDKIYSSRILRSYITASWTPIKNLEVSASVGVAESRTCRVSKRSFGSFYKDIFKRGNRFRPAMRFSLGASYTLPMPKPKGAATGQK
ncbi:MAG: DUF6268 family outer membrane beta-barrel protein [Bacteroidales bacterium]|nr:DUF6268 family outer membrane beta-barrel protein [Bacteroidales bacterium]